MPEIKQSVGYDWAQIVQKGMQEAHLAYIREIEKHKPSNPRSPTYSRDISEWQKILNIPVEAQAAAEGKILEAAGNPRNTSNNAALEQVKKDLAKSVDSKAKVEKDFAELEKRYKELDGKYKSLTRKK